MVWRGKNSQPGKQVETSTPLAVSMDLPPNKATSKGSFRPNPLGEDEEGVEEWVV
jgi:hypothetical protein